jgi:hypothetical protein
MNKGIIGLAAIVAAGIVSSAPAHAANNVMQVCGAKYQAAKANKTLPAGQTWNQFLAQCRTSTAGAPATAAPAVTRVSATTTRQPSAAMAAMHDRQRKCGAQWKADKAAGRIPAGQTWPKYWSACNTRLKS